MAEKFQGDKKDGKSLLNRPEEKLKEWLLPMVPAWLETYHLTASTVIWSLMVIFFSFLGQSDIRWLWGASAMIVAQYVTDLLDGAIGRQRDTGLIKWGYYMDHFLDYIFLCSILIGYSLLVRDHHKYMLFFVLAIFGAFMVNSFLSFAATGKFKISYLGIGPTEIRIVFIMVNTLFIFADNSAIEAAIPYILTFATFGLFVTVYKTQEHIWWLDMQKKHGSGSVQATQEQQAMREQEWSLYLSRRKVIRNMAFSFLIAFAALAILMTRFTAPYHRWTAFGAYILSWVPFFRSFRNRYDLVKERGRQVRRLVFPLLPYILTGAILGGAAYIAHVLIPVEDTPLTRMTEADLRQELDADLKRMEILNSSLFSLLEWIEEENIFSQPFSKTTVARQKQIRDAWRQFADISMQLDILKSKYSGFYQIDRLTKRALHADAFGIQCAAFLAQYIATLNIVEIIDNNSSMDAFLNEEMVDTDNPIPAGSYAKVKQRLTNPDVLIRLNAWSCYLPLVRKDFSKQNALAANLDDHVESIYKSLGRRPSLLITNPRDVFEKKAFTAWFPFQKKVAVHVGRIRSPAHEYRIGADIIKKHISSFRPGDIIIERRNWKMSNISIPGFWTHTAFYTGSPDEIDRYFADLPLLNGMKPVEYLSGKYPEACNELKSGDRNGNKHAVIEALSPGVVFNSPEFTLHADYVSVLRPRLSKKAKFNALCKAMSYFGKPYDFNFDFATDNQLVCSELVYKSIRGCPGMRLSPKRLNGRLMIAPNMFISIFDQEYGTPDAQFDFVLFLDSNTEGRVVERDAESLRKTWRRPKWEALM